MINKLIVLAVLFIIGYVSCSCKTKCGSYSGQEYNACFYVCKACNQYGCNVGAPIGIPFGFPVLQYSPERPITRRCTICLKQCIRNGGDQVQCFATCNRKTKCVPIVTEDEAASTLQGTNYYDEYQGLSSYEKRTRPSIY
jgi:hypothetical protein